jgi:hypothetical protein
MEFTAKSILEYCMKKSSVGFTVLIIWFSFMNMSCVYLGNGNIISSERTLGTFEKIHSSGSYEVRFHISQDYRAVITVDSNLYEYVTLDIKNGTLNIGTKNLHSYKFTKFIADIYCPSLKGVSLSGSGKIIIMDKITASSFDLNVSGSGDMEGTIECETFSLKLSGSGKINNNIICNNFTANISGSGNTTVSGTANDSNIKISGSGNFHGNEFRTNNTTTHISGSGNMNIWVLEYLRAKVSGSGSIKYHGTPKIEFNGSGSGRIRAE